MADLQCPASKLISSALIMQIKEIVFQIGLKLLFRTIVQFFKLSHIHGFYFFVS